MIFYRNETNKDNKIPFDIKNQNKECEDNSYKQPLELGTNNNTNIQIQEAQFEDQTILIQNQGDQM